MRKKYLCLSIGAFVGFIPYALLLFGGIWFLIKLIRYLTEGGLISPIIVFLYLAIIIFALFFGSIGFFAILSCGVYTSSITIYAKKDLLRFCYRTIQYPCAVDFADIKAVCVCARKKATDGTSLPFPRPIPFLAIKIKDDKIKYFSISSMTKRTLKKLINDICSKCSSVGNPIECDVELLLKQYHDARFAVKEFEDW